MKKNNNKGFTLAELLIVVAIIAVLVAIAIPVFTSQLEKSREATDLANLRSAYGEAISQYLTDGKAVDITVAANQTQTGWLSIPSGETPKIGSKIGSGTNGEVEVEGEVYKTGTTTSWHVQVSTDGQVSINGTKQTGPTTTGGKWEN